MFPPRKRLLKPLREAAEAKRRRRWLISAQGGARATTLGTYQSLVNPERVKKSKEIKYGTNPFRVTDGLLTVPRVVACAPTLGSHIKTFDPTLKGLKSRKRLTMEQTPSGLQMVC